MATDAATQSTASISKQEFIDQVKSDYITAYKSRQASLIGRKEVLTGKAKFGIFGDANFGILFWQFLTLLFIIKPAKRLRIDEQLKLRKFKQKYKIDYTIYPNSV